MDIISIPSEQRAFGEVLNLDWMRAWSAGMYYPAFVGCTDAMLSRER
jgi:hypothetical protein